jgi:hypothetical protein
VASHTDAPEVRNVVREYDQELAALLRRLQLRVDGAARAWALYYKARIEAERQDFSRLDVIRDFLREAASVAAQTDAAVNLDLSRVSRIEPLLRRIRRKLLSDPSFRAFRQGRDFEDVNAFYAQLK